MSLPRHCATAIDGAKNRPSWWLNDHVRACKECRRLDAAAGLAEAHEVYGLLHKYRNENRDAKAARKAQKAARSRNRSKK